MVPLSYDDSWSKLRLDPEKPLPTSLTAKSSKLVDLVCTCGRKTRIPFYRLLTGNTKSCGKCTWKPKEYWVEQKWSSLRLDPNQELPDEIAPNSMRVKFRFLCDCGNVVSSRLPDVVKGKSTNCRMCTWKPKEYWLEQKWGTLRLDGQQILEDIIPPSTAKKLTFICECGVRVDVKFCDITNRHTISCGTKCKHPPKAYWLSQKWGRLRLDPEQELPDKFGTGYGIVQFLCDCGKKLSMHFYKVASGTPLSCGCITIGKSETSPAYKVYKYIKELIPEAEFSHWFKNEEGKSREYDIYIPSKKLAIEYHGLIWHSEKFNKAKTNDYKKMLSARERGDRLIQIYEDEWRDKQAIMKEMLRSLIQPKAGKRIKPTFEVHHQTPNESREFLNKHHYLGVAGGCVTICAKHKGEMVGVWVFMKRETGTVLWHRACWDHAYKAWNPHERALALAIPELKALGFTRIITFSDNRFHTGKLYESLGFDFEKELNPDYGYTNGRDRKSKYALRVKAGIDEQAEAEAKGWFRIWDSGKKRFSLSLIEESI